MAIDSVQKRVSTLGVMRPWKRGHYPTGTINQSWRLSSANAYAHGADTDPLEFSGISTLKVNRNRLFVNVGARDYEHLVGRRNYVINVRKYKPGSIGREGGYGNLL